MSVYTWGFYSKLENWLVLFDFRNVPLVEKGAGHKNVTTLAHEGTHQLTFNTGLLNRQRRCAAGGRRRDCALRRNPLASRARRSGTDQRDAAR